MVHRFRNALVALSLVLVFAGLSVASDRDYLPTTFEYDPAVPTPESVLGYPVGEWHVRHDQLVDYFEKIAESSPRIALERYGKSHEARPLLVAYVTAQDKLGDLEQIRERHVAGVLGDRSDRSQDPVVIWMGYGVHGNESSASNASLLLLYFLAAARGPKIEEFLNNAVVIIDPCVNPDGSSRFAHWANSNKSKNLIADPQNREHNETWPGGRTNHYWFDLNRDWLLLTHPESRGRIEIFQKWKPNLLTDYHEMGTNSTYFFQPGIPSRQNPRTPSRNLDLTRRVAKFHASALDAKGRLYYTEESFDDFYYGKGSTYPDVHGAVGILFEQASSRGHLQDSIHGPLSFVRTIDNQFTTSLSSLEAGATLRKDLLAYQRRFYRQSSGLAERDPVKGYVFTVPNDPMRCQKMIDILQRHEIEVRTLVEEAKVGDLTFPERESYVVSCDQPQYRLVQALFETRTEFEDNTFYDVSTWTFPLAFGTTYSALDATTFERAKTQEYGGPWGVRDALDEEPPYAVAFEWHSYDAPLHLYRILDQGFKAMVATRPFTVGSGSDKQQFDYGTIVVPCREQGDRWSELKTLLDPAWKRVQIRSGLTADGIDLGSPSLRVLECPKPLLLVGRGVSAYEAGEVWHLFDQRYDVRLSMVELERLSRVDLSDYTHVIAVQGRYASIGESTRDQLREWVQGGGVFVATKSATDWATEHLLQRKDKPEAATQEPSEKPDDGNDLKVYADYESERAIDLVNGAIFEVFLDRTHPLGFGYSRNRLPVFRNSTRVIPLDDNAYANVAQYTPTPLMSGYASEKNVEKIAGSAAITAHRLGSGTVIRMADNPNFRGFWYGTNKLMANSIFFGGVIKSTRSGR